MKAQHAKVGPYSMAVQQGRALTAQLEALELSKEDGKYLRQQAEREADRARQDGTDGKEAKWNYLSRIVDAIAEDRVRDEVAAATEATIAAENERKGGALIDSPFATEEAIAAARPAWLREGYNSPTPADQAAQLERQHRRQRQLDEANAAATKPGQPSPAVRWSLLKAQRRHAEANGVPAMTRLLSRQFAFLGIRETGKAAIVRDARAMAKATQMAGGNGFLTRWKYINGTLDYVAMERGLQLGITSQPSAAAGAARGSAL